MSESDIQSRPVWDETLAKELIGKVILVGLTHCQSDGSIDRQEEFFGAVECVNQRDGVLLILKGSRLDRQYNLPPDLRSFFKASPGQYRLRSTNEVVINPDFTVTFSVYEQPKD